MQRDRFLFGLTAVFAGMTAFVALVGVALLEPVLFVVAVPLAAATVVFWYQSSGRLRERIRRSRAAGGPTGRDRSGGGFGPGPRRGFEGARGQRARERWEQRERWEEQERRRQYRSDEQRRGGPGSAPSMRPAEAYRRLGLDESADEAAVRRAYREKVKELHPDRGGDEEAFKRVTEAYETLTG